MTASAVVLGTASLATPFAASAADPDGGFTVPDRPDLPAGEASQRIGADASALRSSGRQSFLLKLDVRSTGRAFLANRSEGKQAAASAGRAQLTRIEATQDSVVEELPARTPVLYRTHAALAGVAVTTNVKNYGALAEIPGVAKVYPIATKTLDNSYAVPLQGGDAAWQAHGDLGAGTTVGIIDTGIDFTHANFGGEGTVAAYDAEHAHADDATLWSGSAFIENPKVVGGYDLVGDSYQADPRSPGYQPVPHPDPNPLDCEGHGSHVAGTVAGEGVTDSGDTYSGDYDTSTPFDSLRIGPGMAPAASLLAFRVFGCEGSTDVVTAAIDRALDPNDDGSTADAVDVINMSLGSDFGSPDDADAIAADAASALGVTMAISSGNSYDLYDVGGSPGTSQQAITVAASVDARSVVDRLNVTGSDAGPRHYFAMRSVAFDWSEGDLSGDIVIPIDSETGCDDDPFSPADKALINGNVALLTWTDDALECGSVERSANVEAAGGTGFIFASNLEGFNAGITGSEVIPGVLVNSAGGEEIRDLIGDGETVAVDDTVANALVQNFPDDDNKVTDFSSRGIRAAGNVKPDVAAVGATVFSTAVGTGAEGVTESGTSMAAPMVAGLAALVVAQHPGWTPEQVKADIMNTAGQDLTTDGVNGGDRYAPNRVGSGRIDAAAALDNDVLAYVMDDPGAVSVSFGPLEVTEPLTLSKTVAVENTGSASATYDTSYDTITSVPGVAYDVTPAQVTVAAGESEEVTVTLTIDDPSELTKTVDPTHGVGDLTPLPGGLPAEYLADASGNLLLTPTSGGAPELRVPVYAAPRPASVMSQESALDLAGGEGTLTLAGSDVAQGDDEAHVSSLVAGLELQATSPQAPECSVTVTERCVATSADAGADLRYVGVTSDAPIYDALDLGASNGQAYFGIATHAPHTTAAGKVEFDIYLDVDEDGTSDLVVYNTRVADTDAFLSEVVDLSTGEVVDDEFVNNRAGDVDTAIFDSGVLLMPVWLKPLLDYGVNASAPEVSYAVASSSSSSSNEVDEVGFGADGEPDGSLSANLYEPGVLVTGVGADGGWWRANSPYGPLLHDEDGAELDVQRDPDTYTGQGVLMLHFHNEAGNQAQVVELATEASTLSLTGPASVVRGQAAQLTVTAGDPEGVGTPSGTVTVRNADTNAVVGTQALVGGTATFTYTPTAVGTTRFVASYDGNASYGGSTSAPYTLTATAASRGVTLGASPTSVVRGAPVALTVAVAQQAGDPVPTGAVSVTDGSGAVVASGALGAGGTATLSFTPTVPGTLTLVASYAGDASTTAGTSAPVAVTVTKATSDVDLDVDGKSGKVGKKVEAVAKVATVNGIAPTGKVQLKDGKKVLDTATLVKGKASFDFKPKKPGTLHLQAVYAGDATYAAGSSSKVKFEVKKVKKPKKGKGKKKG